MTAQQIKPAPVRHSVHVKASAARAFEVFAVGINSWWLRTHKIGKSDLKTAVIEPRVGGRWYEIDTDGSECEWGKVLAWEPPQRLLLAWQIRPDFSYDADLVTEVEVTFVEEADGTRVTLEHRNLERFGDKTETMRASVNGGWPQLLNAFAQSMT
jgi:uncharacterized protein YndB with AHSA1/START domain